MNTQEIVKHFEGILGTKEIIITGSTSLEKQGFQVEVKDLDLITTTPIDEIKKTLLRMAMDDKETPDEYPTPMYRIMVGKTKVDLFLVPTFNNEPYFESEGLKWSYATQIVKANLYSRRVPQ